MCLGTQKVLSSILRVCNRCHPLFFCLFVSLSLLFLQTFCSVLGFWCEAVRNTDSQTLWCLFTLHNLRGPRKDLSISLFALPNEREYGAPACISAIQRLIARLSVCIGLVAVVLQPERPCLWRFRSVCRASKAAICGRVKDMRIPNRPQIERRILLAAQGSFLVLR
jgi:hypothetical protein